MKHEIRNLTCIATALIGIFSFTGCSDPMKPATTTRIVEVMPDLEDCAASAEWLPTTPPLEMFQPLPHPTTECPFYRGAWQTFLLAMQPDANGHPALLSYPTIDTTFTSRFKHAAHSYLGDIKQAGQREIAIDQNGRSLYYGIHVNEAYRQFIADNDLKTSDKIQAYPTSLMKKNLFFPAGIAEFKSAWQVVEGDVAAQTAGFISMQTTVPTLSQDPTTHAILEDRDHPQNVTVRLLAIHVVFSLPGHPEFIWGSFEHTKGPPDSSAADGMRDVAPFALSHPTKDNKTNSLITTPVSTRDDFLLYKGGTATDEANISRPEASLHLNAMTQKFIDPATQMPESTSIYRMFPASKSNEDIPDQAITSLNNNVQEVFREKGAGDLRGNYRLVGAQWMDKPQYFADNLPLQNNLASPFAQPPTTPPGIGNDMFLAAIEADGSDSKYSILAGEDRMSSTSMESFTQPEGKFPNCFSCHNTQAINSNGVAVDDQPSGGAKLLDHGLLNVSHVISQFVLEDCYQPANIVPDADNPMIKKAVCPPFVAP